MRIKSIAALIGLFLGSLGGSESLARSRVDIGAAFGPEGMRGFYFSIHQYFGVPEREVHFVRDRRIPDDEIPVVFFVAQRARVRPVEVIDLRLAGRSWIDITLSFGLSPEIFYVPVREPISGPPYGRAYGYFKNKPRKDWTTIRLEDADVVNLVNLKFISDHYRHPAEDVIRLRSAGKNFVRVGDEIRAERGRGRGKNSGDQKKGRGPKKKK